MDEPEPMPAFTFSPDGPTTITHPDGTVSVNPPLPDGSVDVIISNCVINLSTDRPAVFAECFRVLRPGGRLGVSDILAEDDLNAAQRVQRGGQAGCVAGAPSFAEYRGGLIRAGFTGISITVTHQVGDGVHAAVIRAARP